MALVLATFIQACLILRAESLTRASLRVSQRQAVRAKIDAQKRAAETAAALESARKSADAAVAAQRPWISVEIAVRTPLEFKDGAANYGIIVTTKNIGHSPATQIQIWAQATTLNEKGFESVLDKIAAISEAAGKFGFGFSLFPEGMESSGQKIIIPKEEIDAAAAHSPDGCHVTICMVVRVDYKFAGGKGQTGVAYVVWGENPETAGFAQLDIRRSSTPASHVLLQKMPLWDTAT